VDKKRVFAADVGASGGKCFAGTFENGTFSIQELHRFTHEGISFHVSDGDGKITERTFWDDLLIYHNIIKGLNIFRREIAKKLDSIGIDTWGSDGQFITGDGDLLGKIYCYRDHRLDQMIERLMEKISPSRIYEITGIHFQPFNLSNQLLWFMLNRNYLLQPGCLFLPMPTIFYNYLGNIKKIDSTWASVTQLMDAKKGVWSSEVLDKLGIPADVMPDIVPPGTVLGRLLGPVAESVGLNRAKLTAVGSHDTASAFAAAPVADPDDALIISSGTWSIVGKLVPEPITSAGAREVNISNEGGIGNTRLLINCMGTWIVQEIKRIWRVRDGAETDWDEITRLVESATPFTAFIDPDDKSFYNPPDMEQAVSLFCKKTGQPVPKNRAAFLRVVFESLAMKYRLVNDEITRISRKPTKTVNIVGGGSKDDILNQFTADATGLLVLAGPGEATAVGNIMVQASGLGIINGLGEAPELIRNTFKIREYKPRASELWTREYERFMKIVSASKS
jgi:sugar (pentulose or hexulose) kinase